MYASVYIFFSAEIPRIACKKWGVVGFKSFPFKNFRFPKKNFSIFLFKIFPTTPESLLQQIIKNQ